MPLRVLNLLRPSLYKLIGLPWPFGFSHATKRSDLKFNETTDTWSADKMPLIVLKDGICTSDYCLASGVSKEYLPRVLQKLKHDTSQGTVYVSSCKVQDVKPIFIQKVNPVDDSERVLWFANSKRVWLEVPEPLSSPSSSPSKPLAPPTKPRRLQLISAAFMDAFCNMLLSYLIESQVSPHFPLCYCACVGARRAEQPPTSSTSPVKPATDLAIPPQTKRQIIQIICIEYLPASMYDVLRDETSGDVWWSAFFQILASLAHLQHLYDFVHNDCHAENVRVRHVPSDTKLWYKGPDGALYGVRCIATLYPA